jgi:hypothetical protein
MKPVIQYLFLLNFAMAKKQNNAHCLFVDLISAYSRVGLHFAPPTQPYQSAASGNESHTGFIPVNVGTGSGWLGELLWFRLNWLWL